MKIPRQEHKINQIYLEQNNQSNIMDDFNSDYINNIYPQV
jgi:hypothetical protein